MQAKQRGLAENFGHQTELLTKAELRAERGSDYYHGALLDPLSAGLHVGKFLNGLARAAERAGVAIRERTAATACTRTEANPLRGLESPKVPVPFYNGTAWFLPFAGAYYYKAKDRLR